MKTASKICDMLDGLKSGCIEIHRCTAVNDVWLSMRNVFGPDEDTDFDPPAMFVLDPKQLLAFCRAVVKRVDEGETARCPHCDVLGWCKMCGANKESK